MKQSMLFFAGGIGVLALFFLGILPILTKILSLSAQKIVSATPVPQATISPPTLSAPFTATNSAEVRLTGTADPNSSVLLGINGSIGRKVTASGSGNFSFDVTLSQGDNLIFAYEEDGQGNRSDGSNPITITYSTEAPNLEITQPTDGAVITQSKQSVVQVKGKTEAGNKVYLNGQFLFVGSDGSFSGSFQLVQGDNTLTVRAVNSAGNATSQDIHVKYLP